METHGRGEIAIGRSALHDHEAICLGPNVDHLYGACRCTRLLVSLRTLSILASHVMES